MYNCAVIILHSNTFLLKSHPQVLLKISFAQIFNPQTLLKLSHKRYSKLLKIMLLKISDPQALLKISDPETLLKTT